ncbi:DUF2949 domain-containing protein [Gloeothece verrucosa]|uniref:DUF2949 domain-containing protein n=1 Tax=Gloeothece verrucosa (strain PCC 7822) TaxID=497965 RepID=E0UH07_GLOV7|nr:DUF2949 domain-containing protein [Gloeothece verrucosa]ADN15606.1 conserved hypothetical protein [Gloeothece verrucosa PCC 7822]
MESNSILNQFYEFLQEDLFLSSAELAVVRNQQHSVTSLTNLPMLLWQYGLVSLEQLQRVLDWLDHQTLLNLL